MSVPLLRLIAGVVLMVLLATTGLILSALTWSPGFVMRTVAPRWGRWVCAAAGIRIQVEGRENLDKAAVIVANHQSALEVFIVPAVIPHKVRFMAKKEVGNIPFFGWIFRATGQILIDRGDPAAAIAAIDASLATLPKGVSVYVCVEGTRSADGSLLPFKKGAFHIAMRLGLPVVPMTIDRAHLLMRKHAWLPRPGTVQIRIGAPIDTSSWTAENLDAHVEEVRNVMLHQLETLRAAAA